jgi:DNA repair exonuclease SbcCD ATPase subunit
MLKLTNILPSTTNATYLKTRVSSPSKPAQKDEVFWLNTTVAQLQTEVAKLEQNVNYLAEQKWQQEQEIIQCQVEQGVQQLEALAEHINTLANQLETQMLKFKEIALEVNRDYHLIQQPSDFKVMGWNESRPHYWKPLNIWEVHYSVIPAVVRRGSKFVLTAKIVNLFKAEWEVDTQRRAEAAQKRREALERWLVEQHNCAVHADISPCKRKKPI